MQSYCTNKKGAFLCLTCSVYAYVEGRYADQQKKKIVKIMVDDKFDNTGWLGALAAGKIYVAFRDPDKFDDNMCDLVKQLRKALQQAG